ncbi:MAG: tRNA 2-selenouridine(34) synthase MnmH [Bdellovibrionales bacterium]
MTEQAGELITAEQLLKRLVAGEAKLIDVRAPVEFAAGSIPGSVNLPILNDKEREQVGTVYKTEGSSQAVALGHQLVSGQTKAERIEAWSNFIRANHSAAYITCFRGGMRSQLAQSWVREKRLAVPRVAGGYKAMRRVLIEQITEFSTRGKMIVLSGKTGSGKTTLLQGLRDFQNIDLEALANHRGSAFGGYKHEQPSQADFENRLAVNLAGIKNARPVLVEDESRMIGKIVQPEDFFNLLRVSPVLVLDESLEVRIENTFQEYVVERAADGSLFPTLQDCLYRIKTRLGGTRYTEISQDMRRAQMAFRENNDLSLSREWIEKLLVWYYDPLYERSWEKRKPQVLASAGREGILALLKKDQLAE